MQELLNALIKQSDALKAEYRANPDKKGANAKRVRKLYQNADYLIYLVKTAGNAQMLAIDLIFMLADDLHF